MNAKTTKTTAPATAIAKTANGPATHKILVVQSGWVLTGRIVSETDKNIRLAEGSVIRRWGTEHGLGELAINGKTPSTILDPFGDADVPVNSVLFTIDCNNPL